MNENTRVLDEELYGGRSEPTVKLGLVSKLWQLTKRTAPFVASAGLGAAGVFLFGRK